MNFEINKVYKGFKLLEEKKIDEIQSIGRLFEHEKSGARLYHLENDDDNKVFSIGFRTPPEDSTGVPHIVEHCVLSGSRKYTTKEPFMDMLKGSLQTFINAMTFSDKTIYPIASRNEKDFFNLMDVYLDAVFFPKIYEKKEIFMQEGWHYEIFDKDDPIQLKGVVYNEMQGAYSAPESILGDLVARSLYPDTCYSHSSGGDPEFIPDLSYEDFLDFHKKFYHPSNSYIYLYGNGDINKQLEYIDKNYLSEFEREDIDSHIEPQKTFEKRAESIEYYNLSPEEDQEDKTFLTMNFVLGENSDPLTNIMSNLLNYILISSEGSPLKNALLNKGIGEDIFHMSTGGIQTSFGLVAKNTEAHKKDEFEKTIMDTLRDLVDNGIDRDLIRASLSVMEYDLREASGFPTKGLIYLINSFDSWLYDGNPSSLLEYEASLSFLKNQVDTGYFENYIEEKLINNQHSSLLVVKPKKGLAMEKQNKLEERLETYKASLSPEELASLIEENVSLKNMQLTDDSQEDKDTIPKLSLDDIDSRVLEIPQEVIDEGKYTVLYQDIFTSHISYIDFLFDTSMIRNDELSYINLLSLLLASLDTENYSYSQLDNEIYINTGGISLSSQTFSDSNNDDIFYPKFSVKTKTTRENIEKSLGLISEILFKTKIEDKKRIKELIQRSKSRIEMGIFQSGNGVASARLSSYFSPRMSYNDKVSGLGYYWFLTDILKDFDSKADDLIERLNNIYRKIFNINNLIISFTGDREEFKEFKKHIPLIADQLNTDSFEAQDYPFVNEPKNEAIKSISNVQYVAKGYNFKKLGYEYTGSMNVLATILNNDYLHNRVRAQGGAYGVGIGMGKTGSLTLSSYRDPNLVDTLKAYDGMDEFVKNLDLSQEDLTNYIIGAIGSMDPALSPAQKGAIAVNRYISSTSLDELREIKNQVINTSLDDLKKLYPVLKDSMDKNYICVLGNDKVIEDNSQLFNNIIKLNQ